MQNKSFVGILVVSVVSLVLLACVATEIYLTIKGHEMPGDLKAIAFGSFTALLGLLKTAGSGELSQELVNEAVVKAMTSTVQAQSLVITSSVGEPRVVK